MRGPKDQHSSPDGNVLDGGESDEEEEENDEEEELRGHQSVSSEENYDTDLELGGKKRWQEREVTVLFPLMFDIVVFPLK